MKASIAGVVLYFILKQVLMKPAIGLLHYVKVCINIMSDTHFGLWLCCIAHIEIKKHYIAIQFLRLVHHVWKGCLSSMCVCFYIDTMYMFYVICLYFGGTSMFAESWLAVKTL